MRSIKYIITKVLYPACAIFTVTSFAFLIFTTLVSDYQKPAMYIGSYFTFFLLSVLISLSNGVFRIKKMSALSKTVLHAVCVIASITVVFYVSTGNTGSNPLVLILLFTVLYAVIAIPTLLIVSAVNRRRSEKKDYHSMFE